MCKLPIGCTPMYKNCTAGMKKNKNLLCSSRAEKFKIKIICEIRFFFLLISHIYKPANGVEVVCLLSFLV